MKYLIPLLLIPSYALAAVGNISANVVALMADPVVGFSSTMLGYNSFVVIDTGE